MKGSDLIVMSLNIGGELIKIDVPFDEQYRVREAERSVKQYIDKLKKNWPEASDRVLMAMTAYQFANWYMQLLEIQDKAADIIADKTKEIDNWLQAETLDN